MKRPLITSLLAVSVGLAAGVGVEPGATAGTAAYPNSIAVLGHSGATGYDSDPAHPRRDVRANSWATGTNPAVNSVYRRILAVNPGIEGHNINLAQDGATVHELLLQAKKATLLNPKPELILIQIMDNDMRCDGTDVKHIPMFQNGLSKALSVLATGDAAARIFVVSQFGSVPSNLKSLTAAQRKRFGGGNGPCDTLDAGGKVIPKRVAYLESIIHRYEAALAASCKALPTCVYDGGAFGRAVDQRQFISEDASHFSISGNAKAAAVAWTALRRTGAVG
jgi:hypothetical protein